MVSQASADRPATPGGVELTCVDDRACGYATFQSHNQKVVANAGGIFMTYLREDNEKDPAQASVWRLVRSTDGGKTFTTVYEGRNNCRAPCIETDAAGNLYLAHPEYGSRAAPRREFRFYRFDVARGYKTPRISVFGGVSCAAKYAMAYDAKRGRFYIATQYGHLLTVTADGKLLRDVAVLKAAGPKGCTQYPLLQVDRAGMLHHAWTTVKRGAPIYWDIHYMLSADGGATWKTPPATPLKPPIVPDNTGPTLRITLDDEFEPNTWLSSFMAKAGKLHFVYLSRGKPARQHYMRYDLATGRREIDRQPRFAGKTIALSGLDGFFASQAGRPNSDLYCVMHDRGRIACLASRDNGATWRDHARSDQTLAPYAIGGSPQITPDGYLIGSFTHPPRAGQPAKVYFFRIRARPGRQSSPARGERRNQISYQ